VSEGARSVGSSLALDPARPARPGEPTPWLRQLVSHAYRAVLGADGPKAALDALDRFRLLAAHRDGALGVAGLGEAVRRALRDDRALGAPAGGAAEGGWFHGQPVLVTANAPALDLYNGDVGVVLRDGGGALRAWFRTADGGTRGLAPARLPAHEPAFAMTVHKAQGSEFDEVALVLPAAPSPVVTRELLYTAVTRARRRVTVVGTPGAVRAAVAQRVERASGLRDALWGGAP
jgi:exodeoxyribonuclease V alpha subunit